MANALGLERYYCSFVMHVRVLIRPQRAYWAEERGKRGSVKIDVDTKRGTDREKGETERFPHG